MKLRATGMRVALACLLLLLACRADAGTTVLLRTSSKTPPELGPVQTYAGKVDPVILAVKPAAPVTVVLLTDSLSPAELDSVKKDLLTLYASLHGHPLRLAVLRNGAFGVAGPFGSRTQLKNALSEVTSGVDSSTTAALAAATTAVPASASPADGTLASAASKAQAATAVSPALLDNLYASAGQFGADWSRVLLIGELPPLEATAKEYAAGLLAQAFGAAHLQISWYAFSGGDDGWLPLFQSTGGSIIRGALTDFSQAANDASQSYYQVNWTPPVPSAGFVIFKSVLSDLMAQTVLETRDIAASATSLPLPSVQQYVTMRAKSAEAAQLLAQDSLPDASSQTIRDDLLDALGTNPRDPYTLIVAADFFERTKDYAAAARQRTALTEVQPTDPAAFASLGHTLVLASEFDAAETPLQRALALNLRTPQMSEDFARIRLAHKDDNAALPFLAEVLAADPKRQDLWFTQAQTADRVSDSSLAIQSYEQGLALGGTHITEAASLTRLYLATNQKGKASQLAQQTISSLPSEPDVRAQFASSLDDLHMSTEALAAWRRVLEVQANSGTAHLRVTQLLLGSGDAAASEQAANLGLAVVPKFAPLYVAKADALEKMGRLYQARKTLEVGAASVRDTALLARLAATEDTYGGLAAGAYAELAETLGESSPERARAIERGLAVSVRDADLKHVQSFTTMLETPGHTRAGSSTAQAQTDHGSLIPGGLSALAFSAHGKENVPPEKFLVEYCRTLVERVPEQPTASSKQYVEAVLEHFQRIEALEALGKRQGDGTVITLSLNGKDARRRTEKALGLLGMKLRTTKGELELDRGEKKDQAKKQETTSALAIDEVGLQDALKAGKPYVLEINDEWAPVYPGERVWREAFYVHENEPGGIATALLRNPKMARLYIGFSYLDRSAANALLSAVNMTVLEQRYANLIFVYAPALAIQGGHVVVPGGAKAEAVWTSLVGASPAQPANFFRALLEQNNGRLLAFFFTLSQLDRQHQEFFTANAARTSQFYTFFAESEEMRRGAAGLTYDSAFAQFLRSVPLDSQDHVDFPGSPEVWAVAKGHSTRENQVMKMMNKVSHTAAPEVEDELLLHMAETRYKDKVISHSELENFLAVARIDLHRTKPLDEPSALLLAQNYSEFSPTYPYLTEITALDHSDYVQFFQALERLKAHSVLDSNLELGQFHSLIEWICLLRSRHAVNDSDAEKLFKYVCDRFYAAESASDYTSASLESARAILAYCKPADKTATADQKIQMCLLGAGTKPENRRASDFQRILDTQKVPRLESLFAVYDGLKGLKSQGGAKYLDVIKKSSDELPMVELPKGTKADAKEKEAIVRYEPAPVQKTVAELAMKFSKKKVNSSDVEKLSQSVLKELQPQMTLALAGIVYGYFLRSSDLVVSEDALLLRKHHYFSFETDVGRKQLLVESGFNQSSQGIGSYFIGGFAQFSLAAGRAAGVGWKTGGPGGSESIAAQVAAIRSTAWDRLDESDQRLVSLRITVAREWIYMSASLPEAFRALSENSMGVLSLSRRADLLNGIETRNWSKVWESVTLPDLFLLGGKYLESFKSDLWTSPVTTSLRSIAASNDGSRLNILGAIPYHAFGCSHPHLVADAPYEEYERQMFPQELAERSAEFKLFLAFQADNLGVDPAALSDVAETLASRAFRGAQMMDAKDWRSLLAGFGSIMPKDIKQALEQ